MERKAYTTDLTDEQWKLLEPLLPKRLPWGRPAKHSYREILNAMFYIVKESCQWRNLPHDFPPYGTVEYYYSTWKRNGLWQSLHDALVKEERRREGREETPSAGVIDSQSVKTTEAAPSLETAEKRGSPTKRPASTKASSPRAASVTSSSIRKG